MLAVDVHAIDPKPSCPALGQASTIYGRAVGEIVDGRDKPGHDMGKFSSAYKQRLVGNAEAG
jgi:hypothetical protein